MKKKADWACVWPVSLLGFLVMVLSRTVSADLLLVDLPTGLLGEILLAILGPTVARVWTAGQRRRLLIAEEPVKLVLAALQLQAQPACFGQGPNHLPRQLYRGFRHRQISILLNFCGRLWLSVFSLRV